MIRRVRIYDQNSPILVPIATQAQVAKLLSFLSLSPKLRSDVDIPSFTLFLAGLAAGLLLTIWVWGFARSTIRRRDLDLASRDAALTRAQQELSLAQQDRARLGAEVEGERKAAAGRETLL